VVTNFALKKQLTAQRPKRWGNADKDISLLLQINKNSAIFILNNA
jgi:hypothetical protein